MAERIDLLLVNPGNRKKLYGDLGVSLSGLEPPMWCGLLASYARERGFSVGIIDAEAENYSPEETAAKIAESAPLLTAIIVLGSNPSASSTPKMTAVRDTLNSLNACAPQIKTILGGLHPSSLPERTLTEEKVDFVYRGEGFYTLPKVLEVLKKGRDPRDADIEGLWFIKEGRIEGNPMPCLVENLDELPIMAYDLLPMDKYRAHNWHCFDRPSARQPYAVIYTSLGCPFNCSYCPNKAFFGGPGIRFRSPEKVVEEIDLLVNKYGVRNIKVADELFVLNKEHVERFCDLVIARGYDLNFWVYARVDTVTENLLRKMKKAGINWIAYGFESANTRVRKDVAKNFDQEKVKKAIEMTKTAGINIMANFIFGLPEDDLASMQETLNMAKDYNFEYINFYTAMAYPGSQLYDEAVAKGIQLPTEWHGYGQYSEETLPLSTKYLSGSEVLRFRDYAFNDYFSNEKYLGMISKRFSSEVVESLEKMLQHKLKRKYA